MSILVNVVNQKMYVSSTMEGIVAGSQQFVKFRFNLSEEWDGLMTFAQFRQNGVAYNQYLDEENSAYLPPEIGVGTCTLMLYGSRNTTIGTTNYLTLKINENILVSDASSTDISESLYNQLVTKINEMTSLDRQIVSEIALKASQSQVDELELKVNELAETSYNGVVIDIVRDYGADNTGVHDSVGVIYQALMKLKDAGGGTIIFPEGTYQIGSHVSSTENPYQKYLWLYSNTHLVGVGKVVFRPFNASSPKSFFRNFTRSGDGWGGYNCAQNISFENLIFESNPLESGETVLPPAGGPLIGIGHAKNVIFKNCTWIMEPSPNRGTNVHPLEINACSNIKIEDCVFESLAADANTSEYINIDGSTNNSYGQDTYYTYDNCPCKNIEICGTRFNAYSAEDINLIATNLKHQYMTSPAIGNHYPSTGTYTTHQNISIHNCVFHGDFNSMGDGENINGFIRRDTITFGDGVSGLEIYNNVFEGISGNACNKGVNVIHPESEVRIYRNSFYLTDPAKIVNGNLTGLTKAFDNSILFGGKCYKYGSDSNGNWVETKYETQTVTVPPVGGSSSAYTLLWSGSVGSGGSASVPNINSYIAFLVLTAKGFALGWRNGTEFQGGAAFGDVNNNANRTRTISFFGTINGTTLNIMNCIALIHNAGASHSSEYTTNITAIYGLF